MMDVKKVLFDIGDSTSVRCMICECYRRICLWILSDGD